MYRVVIIDDESDAIDVLKNHLSSIQTIQTRIVGTSANLTLTLSTTS
jgi:YesN/AraC family two-component response regulator